MSEEQPAPKRMRLSGGDLEDVKSEDSVDNWKQQDYVDYVEDGRNANQNEDFEEKFRQLQNEATRKEKLLVMRLTEKEQELQDLANQLAEISKGPSPGSSQLHSSLLDPAINLLFQRMKKELEDTTTKLRQAQEDMAAWKFTSDSQTGKRLMSRCRTLLQENQELGKQISQGKIAQLEAELAIQKKHNEELKTSQDELYEMVVQLNEEGEGMQTTICLLQQQLKDLTQELNEKESPENENNEEKQVSNPASNCLSPEPKKENVTGDDLEPMEIDRITQQCNLSGDDRTTRPQNLPNDERTTESNDGFERTTQIKSPEENRTTDIKHEDYNDVNMEEPPKLNDVAPRTESEEVLSHIDLRAEERTSGRCESYLRNSTPIDEKDAKCQNVRENHDASKAEQRTSDFSKGEDLELNSSNSESKQLKDETGVICSPEDFDVTQSRTKEVNHKQSEEFETHNMNKRVNPSGAEIHDHHIQSHLGPNGEVASPHESCDSRTSGVDQMQDTGDKGTIAGNKSPYQDTPQDSPKEAIKTIEEVPLHDPITDSFDDQDDMTETSGGKDDGNDDNGNISDHSDNDNFYSKGKILGTHHRYVPHLTPQSPTEHDSDISRNNHKHIDRTTMNKSQIRSPSPDNRTESPLDENVMNGIDDVDDLNDDNSVLSKKHSPRNSDEEFERTNSTQTLKRLSLEALGDGDGPAVDGS